MNDGCFIDTGDERHLFVTKFESSCHATKIGPASFDCTVDGQEPVRLSK